MRIPRVCCILVILAGTGCSPNVDRAKPPVDPAVHDAAERSVRAVLSEQMKVDSSAIPMDKSISEPPLKADDLDLVEIVMELEERLRIEISDDAVERIAGGKLGTRPFRITPNQLVQIVRDAAKVQSSKRTK